MAKKILLINCAYHTDSITDQMMSEVSTHIENSNSDYEMINIREQEFTACIKCRVCTQCNEDIPGECINQDKMNDIVNKIESSDGYVIASPAKFQATATFFKCFMERLIVYSYWPYGSKKAQPIKKDITKKAILISAFPIPDMIARIYSKTMDQLKVCARLIGAQTIDTLYIGMAPVSTKRKLTQKEKIQAKRVSEKLINSL